MRRISRSKCGLWAILLFLLLLLAPLSAQAESDQASWTPLIRSAAFGSRGDWDGAAAQLDRFEAKNLRPEAHAFRALAYLAQSDASHARPLLDKALRSKATLAEAHYWVGITSLRQRRGGRAVESFEIALSLRPDRPEYRLGRAMAYAASGEHALAVADLIVVAQAEPNLLEPSYHPDERRGVLRLLERALEDFPDGSKTRSEETVLRLIYEAGLHREASLRASKIQSAAALEIRGRIAFQRGELVEATRLFRLAAARQPSSGEARFLLARAIYGQGTPRRALKVLLEASERSPRDLRIQIALGDIYLEQGELSRAELAYSYALTRHRTPHALVGHGRVLELQGDLEGARRSYQQALRLAPGSVEALERLSRLLERLDQESIDAQALQRQLSEATKLEAAYKAQVASIRRSSQDHAEICELLERDPDGAEARLKLRSKGIDPAARSYALIAVMAKRGQDRAAVEHGRAFLRELPPHRWVHGARPEIVARQRFGSTVIVRVTPTPYIVF